MNWLTIEKATGLTAIGLTPEMYMKAWARESDWRDGRQNRAPTVLTSVADEGIQNLVHEPYIFYMEEKD